MTIEIRQNVSLKQFTTLGVGGEAQFFTSVLSETQLQEAVAYAEEHSLEITILGGGSNVLVADTGLSGLVVHIVSKGMTYVQEGDNIFLTVQAGELLDDVVAYCVEKEWWGIENLSHIPGTVGAAPVQNVGAYGVEVKDVINSVRAFNFELKSFEIFSNTKCMFGYRDSFFKSRGGKKNVVTEVTFLLTTIPNPKITYRDLAQRFEGATPSLLEVRDAVVSIRAGKFPNWHETGTAGSFFKNPIVSAQMYRELQEKYEGIPGFVMDDGRAKLSLGWILDKVLHLRGYQEGPVATYENQALVLIVQSEATATDVENFANTIVQKIKNVTGIIVQWEVTLLK